MSRPELPIAAVLFDLHLTLLDQGDSEHWLELAWAHAGLPGVPADLGTDRHRQLVTMLDHVWTIAQHVDPAGRRDLDSIAHREVFQEVMRGQGVTEPLAGGLYATLFKPWRAYDDAVPTLSSLRAAAVRIAVLSNIGVDARPVLDRTGLLPLVDAVVLSFEVGLVKPDPAVFRLATERLGVAPAAALMVGDSAADSGALGAGLRTLLLPRTPLPVHGLDAVLRLAGV